MIIRHLNDAFKYAIILSDDFNKLIILQVNKYIPTILV